MGSEQYSHSNRGNGDGSFRRSLPVTSVPVVTLSQRTDALVRGLQLVLDHHGASTEVCEALSKQWHSYLDTSSGEMVWLKRAKDALTYPLSKYLRNERPPPPDLVWKPAGILRAWMKPRLSAFNRKNTHLWYSWLQAKRSSLPASDDIVDATYEKHLSTLTKADKGDDRTIDKIFQDPTFYRLLMRIRKSVTERMAGAAPFEELSASGSACFEQTRGKGGQHGELRRLCGLDETPYGSELVSMRCDPVVYGRETRYNVVSEVRCAYGRLEWARIPRIPAIDMSKPLNCTIQAVLEPMKVRVISKGEALPYYSCRPLQQALHSTMREMDCFRLIGRPFSPTDMLDLKEKAETTDEWFSIDYSAATDGLSWKYSGKIFRLIIGGLPKHQQDLALSVLGPHALHYPVRGGREVVFKGVMQNGQLMGSILSFPILCLANIGVYLKVTQEAQKGWTDVERLRHVLVNGDDMVYAANAMLWERHVLVAAKVGLEMSVGKAYRHREYANVNSTSVHLSLERKSTPWQINYLNAGLYFGQHKVQGRDVGESVLTPEELANPEIAKHYVPSSRLVEPEEVANLYAAAHMSVDPSRGLAVNLNVLLQGCLPGRQTSLLRRFLRDHREDLLRECQMIVRVRGRSHLLTRNLFLPLSLGGMGVLPPAGWKYETKIAHLQVAQACQDEQGTDQLSAGLPLPGYEVGKLELEARVPWVKRVVEIDLYTKVVKSVSSRMTRKRLALFLGGLSRYCYHRSGVAM